MDHHNAGCCRSILGRYHRLKQMRREDSPPSDYYRKRSGGRLRDVINSNQPAAAGWLIAPSLWRLTAADTEWSEKRPSAQMDSSAVKRPLFMVTLPLLHLFI